MSAAMKWIKVGKGKPKDLQEYAVSYAGFLFIGVYFDRENARSEWYIRDKGWVTPTHYMPLPKPPGTRKPKGKK